MNVAIKREMREEVDDGGRRRPIPRLQRRLISDPSETRQYTLGSSTRKMVAWRSFLPLILVGALIVFENWVSIPSCEVVPNNQPVDVSVEDSEELKVMMVANLLLLGSEAGYMNLYFRDSYMAKFFRKSYERLKPDMLVVLGDVSAKGSELTSHKWFSVLQQFQRMVGPFLSLPLHIVVGDRELGECCKVTSKLIDRISSSLPGLDSSGCGSFEVSNISFFSLNAVALLCGNNGLRFGVEKAIERESIDLKTHIVGTNEATNDSNRFHVHENFGSFRWRENAVSSGSGPVLLLHLPLHQTPNSNCAETGAPKKTFSPLDRWSLRAFYNQEQAGMGPYELLQALPQNATEYIFHALKPRIIFSAHTHRFCDHTHKDGTREVTVPAMTWNARDDPGFIVATFGRNKAVTISQCSLARESHVIMAYVSVLVLLLSTTLITSSSHLLNLGR
ncbi:metallophosphoesterase 1-like [Macadamia integrifolia]|uniref:metallophosphoesterase 1-like n=1 Tax=Macadamia integrifolia TaxID=60698 RepID=UPI001C500951|nr:metallophosphoesterase 1-like [Macadamia integrifolia]